MRMNSRQKGGRPELGTGPTRGARIIDHRRMP